MTEKANRRASQPFMDNKPANNQDERSAEYNEILVDGSDESGDSFRLRSEGLSLPEVVSLDEPIAKRINSTNETAVESLLLSQQQISSPLEQPTTQQPMQLLSKRDKQKSLQKLGTVEAAASKQLLQLPTGAKSSAGSNMQSSGYYAFK